MHWYLEGRKHYAVFSGRARQKEYWFFQLVAVLIFFAIGVLLEGVCDAAGIAQDPSTLQGIIYLYVILYCFANILPALAVSVRRLH